MVESNDPAFAPGDLVFSRLGWREYFNAPASVLDHRDRALLPARSYLSFAGNTGLTAYAGLLHVGSLKPGDVVFVSAASGGARKKVFLLEELGLDAAIDHKAEPNLTKALAREVKAIGASGIDLYFDNVGGDHLQAALALANDFARFAMWDDLTI